MPHHIDQAILLPGNAQGQARHLLLVGWAFLPAPGENAQADTPTTGTSIDIDISTLAGTLSYRNLRPIEDRGDVRAAFQLDGGRCGFHFVLPVDASLATHYVRITLAQNGMMRETAMAGPVIDCADPAHAARMLGIPDQNAAKFVNLLINESERLSGAIEKKSGPISLYIDPSFACNLHCPHCVSETLRAQRFRRQVLKPDMVERILARHGATLIRITFALWGEPLLNRELGSIVRRAREFGIVCETSTNLSVPLSDARIEEFLTAGFDDIRLSIDGTTQETYERYRVGGSLDLVLDNLRRLVAAKQRLGLSRPMLNFQFLEWPWNLHQLDEARALAAELGADVFYSFPGDPWRAETQTRPRIDSDDTAPFAPALKAATLASRALRSANHHVNGCDFLAHSLAINSDGAILPCCYVAEPKDMIGHADDPAEPFNTPILQRMRRFVRDLSEESQSGPSPCAGCGSLAQGHIPDQLGFDAALRILRQTGTPPPELQ